MLQASLYLFTNLNFKTKFAKYVLGQRSVKSFYKRSDSLFSFVGHIASAAVSQSRRCSVKVVTAYRLMRVPRFQQNCLYKKGEGLNLSSGLSLAYPCCRKLHEINGKKKNSGAPGRLSWWTMQLLILGL